MSQENKEEKVEVTEYADGTVTANGIQIVPSPRIDWCGACKSEHGYDCPLDTPQTPSWEEEFDKAFDWSNPVWVDGIYEVVPKLKSFISKQISQAKQEGRREGIEEAILEIIYGCARYTNMHQDTDDVNVAVNTVRADVLSKLDKKRK